MNDFNSSLSYLGTVHVSKEGLTSAFMRNGEERREEKERGGKESKMGAEG